METPNITSSRRRTIRYFGYVIALAALVADFALTLLYALPSNPIKTLTNFHAPYIDHYFYQDGGCSRRSRSRSRSACW